MIGCVDIKGLKYLRLPHLPNRRVYHHRHQKLSTLIDQILINSCAHSRVSLSLSTTLYKISNHLLTYKNFSTHKHIIASVRLSLKRDATKENQYLVSSLRILLYQVQFRYKVIIAVLIFEQYHVILSFSNRFKIATTCAIVEMSVIKQLYLW